MPIILIHPTGVGNANANSPIPVGRANWACVDDYPEHLDTDSYVYSENGTNDDSYDMSTIQTGQRIQINSVAPNALFKRENDTQACEGGVRIRTGGTSYLNATNATLTESWVVHSSAWAVNPQTALFWTIADINAIETGVRLVSAGAGCEAQCTQLYTELDVSILGEYITNYSPLFYKDVIHVDQGFSVIMQEDDDRPLFGAGTVRIDYTAPDGTTGNINGDIIDGSRVIAPVTAALNNQTGKWWFRLYVVLAGLEVLEGVPMFVNVQPAWV